tara:strand:+ start:190 stop:606 length:417 start_codon:yes stop_codon:yes gene_type:complete
MKPARGIPHRVCRVSELPPGHRKIVTIKDREIGIFNLGGRYYALRNHCPHRGAPLCEGKLIGLVTAERPYEPVSAREGEILRCPWHSWEFDITTGQSVCLPDKVRAKCYPADVEKPQETATVEHYDVTEAEGWVVVWW